MLDGIAPKIFEHDSVMVRVWNAKNAVALKTFPIRKAYTLAGGGLARYVI